MADADDFILRVEAELEHLGKELAPLQTGQLRLGEREDDGPWKDTTEVRMRHLQRTIGTFKAILAALKEDETP